MRSGPCALLAICILMGAAARLDASSLPVNPAHPRLLLSPAIKSALLAKKNTSDPSWLALKAQADALAGVPVHPYVFPGENDQSNSTDIWYDYYGEGWFDAAASLALAYQMTGDTRYSDKALQIADAIVAGQSFCGAAVPPNCYSPLQPNQYYASRNLGPAIAILFDWCYEPLGANRRAQMVAVMNAYFNDLRINGYNLSGATGNYFGGHILGVGTMGYASYGEPGALAQTMIDWARIRLDGTASALLNAADLPTDWVAQTFDGVDHAYYGAAGAPFGDGSDFQGWAYGTGYYGRLIDYLLAVRSATGEDLFTAHPTWFPRVLRAIKEALLPNGFTLDPIGDWGGSVGAVIFPTLPARLAYVLAGSADGPGAQHFLISEIRPSPYDNVPNFALMPWEDFFFSDPARPAAELALPPYYTGFGTPYPQGDDVQGAIPNFTMRSGWQSDATWATAHMGSGMWGDHQHKDAGQLTIARGSDFLLVDASQWQGPMGGNGLRGGSNEADVTSAANTLFFDDYGDCTSTDFYYFGGQGYWGRDAVIAAELDDDHGYVRSDLSSAYDFPCYLGYRRLDHFYRSLLYLRSADLFVVYDQVAAKPPTNPKGSYAKHLRWHFPNRPTVTGNSVYVTESATTTQGTSGLYLDTLLPAGATITPVDESTNPDRFPIDSNTWRVEVKDPANPQVEPFLTVIQAGPASRPHMTSSLLATADGKMAGASITQPGGATNVVLFNSQEGQTPPPVTTTSYPFGGPASATHTLMGMMPNQSYVVGSSGSIVSVTASPGGSFHASAAGVLSFTAASFNLPSVTTTAVSGVTATSALSGGNVTSDGGSPVTARGVCWSTAANPTIADPHTSDGLGTGIFASTVSGLAPGTYSLRAYATNANGTSYGDDLVFGTAADYYSLPPCRLVDTRRVAVPLGGPALAGGGTRRFDLAGVCGVPATATALSLNVTIVNPSVSGFLTAYGAGLAVRPNTSTLNFKPGRTRANNAVLAVSSDQLASLDIYLSGGVADVVLDVTGYFR